jgi:molecular chaperone HtpG
MTQATQKETLGFQSEVNQILKLVIHSLYSNKEIFLRELISNASDAADKLRFAALTDNALYEGDSDLQVQIDVNKEAKTITLTDNGIGMSREEVVANLGTIAKSGTREFLAALSGDQAKDAKLIGQFGVGFYSSFIVADKVTVETRRAGLTSEHGVLWESTGEGNYTIENIEKPTRGTTITLHIKSEENEFLEPWRLRTIINKYSDHIPLPVKMQKEIVSDEKDKEEHKPVEYETVNRATALWTLPKSEIKNEEYTEFYKHIAHDFEEPLAFSHNKVEGKLQYITLLYLPARAPFDLWHREHVRGLKLYVQRVFIMDNAEQFLPHYLRFVKGVVDSNDLPLNISREILQNNKTIDTIRSAIIKRVLDMLTKMVNDEPENYNKFWKEFGQVLKEGPAEDFANKEEIAKLLRFATTRNETSEQTISLDDYLAHMKPGQDKIYYITADNFNAARHSPQLEIFQQKGIEVLLLTDRIDEWLVANLTEYQGKQWQSVAKGEIDLGGMEDEQAKEETKKQEDEFSDLTKRMKEILGDKVKEVRVSQRLTDSPACIVSDENDLGGHMQRILQAAGQPIPASKPILEVNPTHPIVLTLKKQVNSERFSEMSNILLEQSILAEGGQLEDPALFIRRLNGLLLELSQ